MEVNPALFVGENHYALPHIPVNLDLGIYGSVHCDLPREVVWDALAINLGTPGGASFQGRVSTIMSILNMFGQ